MTWRIKCRESLSSLGVLKCRPAAAVDDDDEKEHEFSKAYQFEIGS